MKGGVIKVPYSSTSRLAKMIVLVCRFTKMIVAYIVDKGVVKMVCKAKGDHR